MYYYSELLVVRLHRGACTGLGAPRNPQGCAVAVLNECLGPESSGKAPCFFPPPCGLWKDDREGVSLPLPSRRSFGKSKQRAVGGQLTRCGLPGEN